MKVNNHQPLQAENLPAGLSRPALRALREAGIATLADANLRSDAQLLWLHGFGPKGLAVLRQAIAQDLRSDVPPSDHTANHTTMEETRMNKEAITIETTLQAPLERVWQAFTTPADIVQWNSASDDWHTPSATNDVQNGGRFVYRMEARDGSAGFDFSGVYHLVEPEKQVAYTLDDGRSVYTRFEEQNGSVRVIETFEPEKLNSLELQRAGWLAILEHFKRYVEQN